MRAAIAVRVSPRPQDQVRYSPEIQSQRPTDRPSAASPATPKSRMGIMEETRVRTGHQGARFGSRRPNQPTVVDLFAGCGGLSLGLERAGFRPVYVNELGVEAMATYLVNRLVEYPDLARYHSYDIFDLTGDETTGRGGQLEGLASELRQRHGEIDLVVGGPPCQGYSGIGHRRTFTDLAKVDIPSNHLYREMAKVVAALRPRMFMFENVKGLLSSRWTPDGEKGEIWKDVQLAFRRIEGYEIHAELVQAKQYGVPQNRPRVLMVGIRRDLGFTPLLGEPAMGLLPSPSGTAPDPVDYLGDLVDPEYADKSATIAYPTDAGSVTQERFRRDPHTGHVARAGDPLTEHEYSRHDPRITEKFRYMLDHGGDMLDEHRTKKFAQRVIPREWGPGGPSVTATSLPDDYVHFSQPRTLTVREWARMQTFPDWYQFAGKRTTGGRRRAGDPDAGDWTRELPKYTQIGNAVPVWLAEAVGRHFRRLLG